MTSDRKPVPSSAAGVLFQVTLHAVCRRLRQMYISRWQPRPLVLAPPPAHCWSDDMYCLHAVRYGIECPACKEKGEYLTELIYRLALPVRLSGSGGRLEVLDSPFIHQAYAKQMYEQKHEFMQRFFAQLVGMVHSRFLSDMHVTCTSMDPATRQCHSHLPLWTYANADEYAHIWGMTPEMMRGTASVTQPLPSSLPSAVGSAVAAAGMAVAVTSTKGPCSGRDDSGACTGQAAGGGAGRRDSYGGEDAANATDASSSPSSQPASTASGTMPPRTRQQPPAATDSLGRRLPVRQPPTITTFEEAGGYTLLDRDRVRAYAVKDMNALIDKFVSSDIAGDVQSLLSTLDYLSSIPGSSGSGGSGSSGSSAAGGGGRSGPSCLGSGGALGSGGSGQVDYTEKLQVSLSAPRRALLFAASSMWAAISAWVHSIGPAGMQLCWALLRGVHTGLHTAQDHLMAMSMCVCTCVHSSGIECGHGAC